MSRVQKFTAGVKPLREDFNAIGENRLDAFEALLDVFTLTDGSVLFAPIAPTTDLTGTILTIVISPQTVGIGGMIGENTTQQETYDLDDGAAGLDNIKVEVYFVMRGYSVTATRNFQDVNDAGRVAIQNLEAEIAKEYRVEIEMLSQGNIAGPDQLPVLGPDDLGYVKLANVIYNGVDVVTTLNDSATFSLPAGAAVPVTTHASTHLPGGADPIQLAALDNTLSSGSKPGLLPEGALTALSDAVTDIVPTTGSTFINFASTGQNLFESPYSQKLLQITFNHNESLTVITDQSVPQLSVSFPPATLTNGQSRQAARSDHQHKLSESGYLVINKTFAVTLEQRGQIIDFVIDSTDTEETVDQILGVDFYFELRNLSSDFENHRLEMPFFAIPASGGTGTVGARVNITGDNTFQAEFGSLGYLYMSGAQQNLAQSWTSPSYGEGTYPRNGTVHMVITALREGAGG